MKFAATCISILPEEPCALSGLEHRDAAAETLGIKECNLRIAWLEVNQDEQLIFFLADLLFFPAHLADLLAVHLLEQFQISRSNLIFAGTHNHSGPALGFLPWENENLAYEEQVFDQAKQALAALPQQLKTVILEVLELPLAPISINRRKRIRHWRRGFVRKALMLPNPQSPTSQWMRILRFIPKDEEPTLFISYASHPVFNRSLSFSSDYPGRVAQLCQEQLGVKEVFCFQGFGGDLRPNFQGQPGWPAKIKSWFHGPEFADYTHEHLESFCQQMVRAIKEQETKKNKVNGSLSISEEHILLRSESGNSEKTLALRQIAIGDNLKWLLANAELFCAYQNDLPAAYFPIGCTTKTIGYIPTQRELEWGGYEVEEAARNNGMDSPLKSEDVVKVEDYFDKVKRAGF